MTHLANLFKIHPYFSFIDLGYWQAETQEINIPRVILHLTVVSGRLSPSHRIPFHFVMRGRDCFLAVQYVTCPFLFRYSRQVNDFILHRLSLQCRFGQPSGPSHVESFSPLTINNGRATERMRLSENFCLGSRKAIKTRVTKWHKQVNESLKKNLGSSQRNEWFTFRHGYLIRFILFLL